MDVVACAVQPPAGRDITVGENTGRAVGAQEAGLCAGRRDTQQGSGHSEGKGATTTGPAPPAPHHAHPRLCPAPFPRSPKVGQDEHSYGEGGQGDRVAHGVDHAQAVKHLLCRWGDTQGKGRRPD